MPGRHSNPYNHHVRGGRMQLLECLGLVRWLMLFLGMSKARVGKPFELWVTMDYLTPLSVITNWLDPFLGMILSIQGMLFVCLLKIFLAHAFSSFLACVQVQDNAKLRKCGHIICRSQLCLFLVLSNFLCTVLSDMLFMCMSFAHLARRLPVLFDLLPHGWGSCQLIEPGLLCAKTCANQAIGPT